MTNLISGVLSQDSGYLWGRRRRAGDSGLNKCVYFEVILSAIHLQYICILSYVCYTSIHEKLIRKQILNFANAFLASMKISPKWVDMVHCFGSNQKIKTTQ